MEQEAEEEDDAMMVVVSEVHMEATPPTVSVMGDLCELLICPTEEGNAAEYRNQAGDHELHCSRFTFYDDPPCVLQHSGRADDDDSAAETNPLLITSAKECIAVDAEGDLVVPRRPKPPDGDHIQRCAKRPRSCPAGTITILHTVKSNLPSVGLQVSSLDSV